jgi:hypothetical protein
MSTIAEKTSIINISPVARRIKRELEKMIDSGICNFDNISISKNYIYNNEIEYHVNIFNNIDNRNYEFILTTHFPFKPPKLILNYKPYSEYLRFMSHSFRDLFYKYNGHRCFCCETKTCSDNWGPNYLLVDIMNEVNQYHKECKEIADIICINVIKRKYLINDINIFEWLY